MNEDFLTNIQATPLATVAGYYAGCLDTNPKAVAFIVDELQTSSEQASTDGYGFADRTLGKQIPHSRLKAGRKIRQSLKAIGLLKANGREALRGYVTVPIRDDQGTVIGIRGYKVDPHASGAETMLVGRDSPIVGVFSELASARNPSSPSAASNNATGDLGEDADDNALIIEDAQIVFKRDDRRYRIRGLEKNTSLITLKINLMVSRQDLIHMDTLDLVKARSRASFIKATASELFVDAETVKTDIGKLLLQLETLQSDRIAALKAPAPVEVKLSKAEQREALALLCDPNLLQRIVADMDACGTVGESTNKLVGYLAATSRKLSKPLAVVIQSSSSAGKTSLMDAILKMMPDEDVNRFSGMTGQSLFYLDSNKIKHKTLAISEEEGIAEATYALKLLQSEGELRHATVGRGEDGRAQTQEHHVEGPVQIFLTTTAMEIDEELLNRFLVLSVDETHHQTGAIQLLQRAAFTVDVANTNHVAAELCRLHQNAQRLLRPLEVYNPYAPQLTFPNHKTRMRRDHLKYLTLINTIAFLHQHQRTVHTRTVHTRTVGGNQIQYINVQRSDIAMANGLAGEVLGRSLDELSPQTRNLLTKLHTFVSDQAKSINVQRNAFRFTRRDLRETIQWSDYQVRSHLKKLVDLEYVLVHRGSNGQRYVYELLYAGEGHEGQPFLMGLIDPAKLQSPAPTTKTPSITVQTPSIESPTPSMA